MEAEALVGVAASEEETPAVVASGGSAAEIPGAVEPPVTGSACYFPRIPATNAIRTAGDDPTRCG